ncbi:MAG: type II toxin-antitoxin system VapC family toxin [Gemmatimonadaceae bacterium]|nr:type II toxin-antitoxin system VapC family toxin [Gemmatimonadaceae bacterium]
MLWALHDPTRLSALARDAVSDPQRAVYFSAASAWELELKAAKGKLALPAEWIAAATATGFIELPVTATDARMSAQLPWHHNDPFDRMLIAQARHHGLQLATRDPLMSAYDVPCLAV